MLAVFSFTVFFPSQSKVQAKGIESEKIEIPQQALEEIQTEGLESEKIEIPQQVLENVPAEIKDILEGKTITKEHYEAYLQLIEKENQIEIDNGDVTEGITPFASTVNPKTANMI